MTPQRQVVLGMTIAGLIFVSAYGLQYANESGGGRRLANPLPKLGGVEMFMAWGILFVFLIVMAEIPNTGQLAAAFVWLIVLAVLFTYGVAAFQNLLVIMGQAGGKTSGSMDK